MNRLFLLCAMLMCAAPLGAQIILGTVTDSASGMPLADVNISMQDSTGVILAELRTGAKGEFTTDGQRASALRFVVRKIGAQPSYSDYYALPETADTVEVALVAPIVGATLATVTVREKARRITFNDRQLDNARESGWQIAEPWRVASERETASSFEHLLRRVPLSGVKFPARDGDCFTNARNRRCLTIVVDGLILDPYAYVNPRNVYFVAYISANSALMLYGARAREGALYVATRRAGDDERKP